MITRRRRQAIRVRRLVSLNSMSKKDTPLIKSVIALDNYLAELERVGTKINGIDMTSDVDTEFVQKLMARFAECGEGVSREVTNLSTQLQESQLRAQAIAQGVSNQASRLNQRRSEENAKLEEFRLLGEKVRELNTAIGEFRRPKGGSFSDEDRAKLMSNIPHFETQMDALITELKDFSASARNARMKALEKNADSLAQTLQAARKKLRELNPG
jgi:chromosome segregation ATPase